MKPTAEEEVKKIARKFHDDLGEEHSAWKEILETVLRDGAAPLHDKSQVVHELNQSAAKYCIEQTWAFAVNCNRSPNCPKGAEAIGKGKGYRIWAWPNPTPVPIVETGGAVRQFWAPYVGSPWVHYVFAEPLFWTKPPQGRKPQTFLRDFASNSEDDQAYRGRGYQPSYHYLSAGDVVCRYLIFRYLLEAGMKLDAFPPPVAAKRFDWKSVHTNHCVIVVGSGRANFHINRLTNADFRWQVADACIMDLRTQRPLERENSGDGAIWEHAVITRSVIEGVAGGVLTTICSNHGRAIEASSLLLTKETKMSRQLRGHGLEKLPESFQALIKVLIDKEESRPEQFDIVEIHEIKAKTVLAAAPQKTQALAKSPARRGGRRNAHS